MITINIGPAEDGSRLDRLLRKRLPLLGLSSIYGLIRKGAVRVNDKKAKQDHRLKEGEILTVNVDESELAKPDAPPNALAGMVNTEFFKRNFNIIYEDAFVIVCDKPAGLVVHSGSGHRNNDNLIDLATAYVMSSSQNKNVEPPVLMHRLDRDTSGVILLAKNTGIVRALHENLRAGNIRKQYLAICHGRPPEFEGTVSTVMRRNDNGRKGMKMSVITDGDGREGESSTSYKILEHQNDLSRLELLLHTGKTHQIRVHMAHVKSPILGDDRYGDKRLDDKVFGGNTALPRRLYLHAHKLSFPHPKTKKSMTFTAPPPKGFARALETNS